MSGLLLDNHIEEYMQKSKTTIIFGWEKSMEIRNYIDILIKEIQQYLYIGNEVFFLVSKPVTETEFYLKFVKNLGPAEIFPYECQNPGLSDLAQVFSVYRKNRQRIVVGMGGGSIMDLAKAIAGWAYHPGFIPAFPLISEGLPVYPLLLVPTMSGSGSEVTPYIVMTDKQGCMVTNGLVFPHIAIVDPYPTLSTLHYQTVYAALTAFAQALEALVSRGATEETDSLAFKAIEIILVSLPGVLANKGNREGRENLALASVLAGLAMKAGLGLATSMAQQIHDLPYGLILSLFLPSIIEYNESYCWEKYERVNNLFLYRSEHLSKTIQDWFSYLGIYSFDGMYRKNMEAFLHSEYCIRLSTRLVIDNIHYGTNPRQAEVEDIKNLFFSLHTIPIQVKTIEESLLL
ncbi:MAG TPA: iron-containing alcohol dehydrogenase [Candidatus Eremiobacteraeota bacterium]|nr:MAG: NAD-dependent methanol dehydrogenase [bacterium ADurb.Bin363]HPZ08290.1 iron-containing alcohol dehydrogenase [Candidatus Eremiobacteraeota bacterium]